MRKQKNIPSAERKESGSRPGVLVKYMLYACVSLCMVLSVCSCGSDEGNARTEKDAEQSSKAAQQNIPQESKLELSIAEDQHGELAFDISIDDFVDSYNGYYLQEHDEAYLKPVGSWRIYTAPPTIHSAHESTCYAFSEDESVRSLPVLLVYTPGGSYIRQITVSYDDHSYSPHTYEIYEEMCFYVLKVMLPELGDDALMALRDRMNGLLDDGIMSEASAELPYIVYHEGGVGVYPYYAAGHSLEIRVIPVTEGSLEELALAGVKIERIADCD